VKQTIIITIFMLATIPLFTQDTDVGNMSSILNPDGTVMPGITGSFNASGFEMKLGLSGNRCSNPETNRHHRDQQLNGANSLRE